MSVISPITNLRQCVGIIKTAASDHRACPRKVTWFIRNVGPMCNWCYDVYFSVHAKTIDVADIRRLSDNDDDFLVRSTAGMGNGGYPTHKSHLSSKRE